MNKLLPILAVLVGQITCLYAQDNDPKIWEMTYYYGTMEEKRPDRGESRIKKYGDRDILFKDTFFENYTAKMLYFQSDQKSKDIDSMIYYGRSFNNFDTFGCKVIKGDTQNFHLWHCAAFSEGKIVFAVTEPRKRDYTIEHLKRIDLNMIMDSLEPVTDNKPDAKYLGDKILGQYVIDKKNEDLSDIQLKEITVNTSDKDKITHIEIQTHKGEKYKFTFDPVKKTLVRIEDKK